MSKLDESIRELCPDGVEYKKLGEIATVLRGASPRPIKKYITNDSDGVNWIKIGDADESMYITKTAQRIKPEGMKKSRYVKPGDFLLSKSTTLLAAALNVILMLVPVSPSGTGKTFISLTFSTLFRI